MEEKKKTDGLKEVAKEIIGWEDNKLFLTLKHLTTKPSQVITEFCKGEKHKYLSPVVYYFGVEALKSYLYAVSGLSDFLLRTGVEKMRLNLLSMKYSHAAEKIATNQMENSTLSSFFTFYKSEIGNKIVALPILLLLTWLFYKKYNHSFKENSWFAFYSSGHASLFTIPLALCLYMITKDFFLFGLLFFVITSSYWIWASIKFYSIKTGKAILLRLLMFLTILIILNMISYIIVIVLAHK